MAMKGKDMAIKVSTDGAAWNDVADIKEGSMNNAGNNIDISVIDNDYINRMQGLKDVTYSLSGFYNSSDTNGQTVIRTAWENASNLYIGFLPDGTDGWEQKVVVSAFDISGDVGGAVELSIELEGADAVAAYS